MPSQPSDEGDVRFSWLLEPIRDLTKNWNVDVASLLEQYLGELESISISFEGGAKSMNFAEAALLIQGSACVYSKKVEYLYALVYQTLDLITKSKRNQQPSSVDAEGKDADVSIGKTHTETFLELDDVQENKNIDLKEDEGDLKSLEKSCIIPKTPLALLPTSEMTKRGQDLLMSHKGEVIGSKADFKMNTCTIHHSGTLLLDTNCIPILEKSLRALYSSTPVGTNLIAPLWHVIQEAVQGDRTYNADDYMAVDDGFNDDGMDMGPLSPQGELEDSQKTPPRRELRNRDAMHNDPSEPRFEDPWEGLNPYDDSKFTNREFKKGKPYRIPPSMCKLTPEGEKKRKRSKKNVSQRKQHLETLTSFLSNSAQLGTANVPALKKPSCPEFNAAFVEECLKRQDFDRLEREYLREKVGEEVYQDLNSMAEEVAEEIAAGDLDNDDKDDRTGFGLNDDYNNSGGVEADLGDQDFGSGFPNNVNSNNNNWDDCVVSSYEDLVRKYVNNRLIEAQQYATETDISKRVKNWEERIKPILQEEESHRPYDIHCYAMEILDTFKDEEMTFREMVSGKQPYEVCRYFLSTLLMANMRNLDIVETDDLEVDMMRLRLLDRTPAHEKISEYLAPSLTNGLSSQGSQ